MMSPSICDVWRPCIPTHTTFRRKLPVITIVVPIVSQSQPPHRTFSRLFAASGNSHFPLFFPTSAQCFQVSGRVAPEPKYLKTRSRKGEKHKNRVWRPAPAARSTWGACVPLATSTNTSRRTRRRPASLPHAHSSQDTQLITL